MTDACERHDPCQHGGICISTDSGPICECRNLEYEGTYCERGENLFSFLFLKFFFGIQSLHDKKGQRKSVFFFQLYLILLRNFLFSIIVRFLRNGNYRSKNKIFH